MNTPGLPHYVTWKLGGDAVGTYLQGSLEVSYADLVTMFGKPTSNGDGYKVDAEWEITFTLFGGEFEKVATIYNYKDSKNYCGKNGLPVEEIRDWHIGGKESEVVGYIASMLLNAKERARVEP